MPMQIILKENIRNLGKLGETVTVKPGFARNYLFPRGKAILANKANSAFFETQRAHLEKEAAKNHADAEARKDAIEKIEQVTISARVSEEGKLYGSVGPQAIAGALLEQGMTVARNEINLPQGAIGQLGVFPCEIHLSAEVVANLQVQVTAEVEA